MFNPILLIAFTWPSVLCQVDNANQNTAGPYYLDSNADCNGPVREIYGQTARIIGHGAVQVQQGPQSCTLSIKSASNFDRTNLLVQVVASAIRDCDVRLTIYDGDPSQGVLKAYDCNYVSKPNDRDLQTTGDTVSFMLERRSAVNTLYDIDIFVTPLVSGTNPGYENGYGSDFGFYREKFPNQAAVGVIGGAFLLLLIIVTVTIIFCLRRHKGLNKPWEQHQLSGFTAPASVYTTKSKISDSSSDYWANAANGRDTQPKRRPAELHSRMSRPSEDGDSVFDSDVDIPSKKHMMERDRQMERRNERERNRRNGPTHNSSYVQADDDHPQDTFVERIITPRVKQSRIYKPPSYAEAVNDVGLETESTDIEEKEQAESSYEEEEKASSEEEEKAPSEEEEEEKPAPPKPAPRPVAQPPPPPPLLAQPPSSMAQLPPMSSQAAGPLRQPAMQPYPVYPPPMQFMSGYPMQPGQFVPVMAGPAFQPVGPRPAYAPPRYPGGSQPGQPGIKPTDPPVYSYLVQRGYTPLDVAGRNSPVSSSNSQQVHTDDPDAVILDSGVEYMRR